MEYVVSFTPQMSFDDVVLKSNIPVIIDFYADWCGPCKRLGPVLEEKAKTLKKFLLVKVNVDENPDLSEKYNVGSIPFVLLFINGQKVKDFLGFDQKALEEMIASC